MDMLKENDLFPQPDIQIPQFYIECGQIYRQKRNNKNYEAAIMVYNKIIDNFPNTEFATTASKALGDTYKEWGQYLFANQEYVKAMDKLAQAQKSSDDPDIVATIRGYNDALLKLSQDTGAPSYKINQRTWAEVCKGNPATFPGIGVSNDNSPNAWFGGLYNIIPFVGPYYTLLGRPENAHSRELVSKLVAANPAHFLRAVCIDEESEKLETCLYGNTFAGGSITRYKILWLITIRNTLTAHIVNQNTFSGTIPEQCPNWTSSSLPGSIYGDPPSTDVVIEWLLSVLRDQEVSKSHNHRKVRTRRGKTP